MAIVLAPDELEIGSSRFEEGGLRKEVEMLASRRRAALLGVAMLAMNGGKLKICDAEN